SSRWDQRIFSASVSGFPRVLRAWAWAFSREAYSALTSTVCMGGKIAKGGGTLPGPSSAGLGFFAFNTSEGSGSGEPVLRLSRTIRRKDVGESRTLQRANREESLRFICPRRAPNTPRTPPPPASP